MSIQYFEVKLSSFGRLYLLHFDTLEEAKKYRDGYELIEDEEDIEIRLVTVVEL